MLKDYTYYYMCNSADFNYVSVLQRTRAVIGLIVISGGNTFRFAY